MVRDELQAGLALRLTLTVWIDRRRRLIGTNLDTSKEDARTLGGLSGGLDTGGSRKKNNVELC